MELIKTILTDDKYLFYLTLGVILLATIMTISAIVLYSIHRKAGFLMLLFSVLIIYITVVIRALEKINIIVFEDLQFVSYKQMHSLSDAIVLVSLLITFIILAIAKN